MNPISKVMVRALIAFVVYVGLGVQMGWSAAPANDNFSDAVEIASSSSVAQTNLIAGTTVGATLEPGENNNPDLAAYDQRGTIWWKWTCPAPGEVEFTAYSQSASLMGGAFTGSSVSSLTTFSPVTSDVFWHPDFTFGAGGAFFLGEAGTTYFFAVMPNPNTEEPAGEVQGMLIFRPTPPPGIAPTNDLFANPIVLVGTNLTVQGNNAGASTEGGESIGSGYAVLAATVWYSWTAPTNGVVYFSGGFSNPNYWFSLGIYRGTALNALTVPPLTGDGGFVVEPGDTFRLQVASVAYWGSSGQGGVFALNVRMNARAAASSNDRFADRFDITFPAYHFDGSIYGATNEPGEPLPSASSRQTLWWKFVAPENGLIRVVPSGPFVIRVAAYEGNELGSLTSLPTPDGNRFPVRGGHEYAIQAASDYVPTGGFSIDTLFRSASNDMFAGSVRLEGTNITAQGDPIFATIEPNEPNTGYANTIWYSWAAPATGRAYCSPIEGWWRSMVVYRGQTLQTLEPVRYVSADNGVFCFLAEEGTVYHFQYSGEDYEPLSFWLQLLPFESAPNDHFANALAFYGAIWSDRRSVMGATMELGEPGHLGDGVATKSIWWKWQAPTHGDYAFMADRSLVTNLVLAVYQGNSVESLSLVAKGTTGVAFFATGGQTFYVAAAVPENEVGDVILNLLYGAASLTSIPVPGNLLREPSFEGTGLNVLYWGVSGGGGGYVNERGGADGTTWPTLNGGAKLWQDFPTVPGHRYQIRFAYANPGVRLEVSWDNRVIGVAEIPPNEGGWHWPEFTAYASNTTSRVTFKNLGANVQVDAFSVVDVSEPPAIVTEPKSVSTVAGGTAAFVVGVKGLPPLNYQWFLNDSPLSGQTNRVLALNTVAPEQAGNYRVSVMNEFGSVTSVVATLTVDNSTNVTILLQPRGDEIAEGGYFNLSVVAAGSPPLNYQWFRNGAAVANATNRNFALTNAQPADGGRYEILVQNYSGSVWSLPANVVVTNGVSGGGLIDFRNRFLSFVSSNNEAPVFDLDGVTRLNGSTYVAQLYAGPSLEAMKAVGPPAPFRTGFDAGFFVPQTLTLPNVAPGGTAFVQVRAWEINRGSSYEEARALGGKFGRSEVLQIVTGGGTLPPRSLLGLNSFSLQAGLPGFTVGLIEYVETQPDNVLVWLVRGEAGFRYVVEKALLSDEALWRPYTVLTNMTGTVTFTDVANSGTGTAFYRARILD